MTKKTRMYYDCPIVAMYMELTYGIKLIHKDGTQYDTLNAINTMIAWELQQVAYVAPEGERRFEELRLPLTERGAGKVYSLGEKAFFMPKIEEITNE